MVVFRRKDVEKFAEDIGEESIGGVARTEDFVVDAQIGRDGDRRIGVIGKDGIGRQGGQGVAGKFDFLLDERIRELVGEENRRYTLCRTGKLAERVKMMMDKWAEGTESKMITGFDASKHTLLPIPLSEIQLNKDADLQQNPGY